MAAPAAGTTAPSGDVEDMYYFKILSARGLELEKKDVQLYVKVKCVGTKQTLKTKMVDGFKPEWKEELMFSLNPSKVRKMADRIIEFKLMCKAHVMDDCIGSFEVALDAVPSPIAETWVPLVRRKKTRGELHVMTHVVRASDKDKYSFEAKYTMGKEIGRGGFSIVYEATSKETGDKVAVKVT